jgi:predicted DNA-binding transcriptional regulator YafY
MEQSMVDQGIPLRYDDEGRLYIDREAYVSNIRLKLDEAVVVFLAGRLLARYSDKPNAHVVNALEKLGTALYALAPSVGRHIVATSTALAATLPPEADHQQRILEILGRSWAEGRIVQITYRPLRSRRSFDQPFAPYLLEPSGIGFAVYAIGLAGSPGVLRTRKVERIERATLTDETFEVPADFDPNKLLAGAWAIWFDEGDQPQRVTLRFSHFVAKRVRETRWHPSQHIDEDAEGRVIWTAEVDALQEMLPWIRGWGADCEVLEPKELREQMIGETARLARLYGQQHLDLGNREKMFDDIFG